jgi:hypothetical protein
MKPKYHARAANENVKDTVTVNYVWSIIRAEIFHHIASEN